MTGSGGSSSTINSIKQIKMFYPIVYMHQVNLSEIVGVQNSICPKKSIPFTSATRILGLFQYCYVYMISLLPKCQWILKYSSTMENK